MEFLSSKEVSISGGYLTKNGDMKSPVNHSEFVAAQKEANVLCMLAAKVTLTDFTVKKVPLFRDLMEEVRREKTYKKEIKYEEVNKRGRVLLLPHLLFPQSSPSPLSLSSLLANQPQIGRASCRERV